MKHPDGHERYGYWREKIARTRDTKTSCMKKCKNAKMLWAYSIYDYDVHLRPLPLGYAGSIYKKNLKAVMDLGISRTAALAVLKKLNMHAIRCLHNIITARKKGKNATKFCPMFYPLYNGSFNW